MKFQIKHEIKGRMRLHIFQKKQMSCEQADILLYYLENIEGVESAKVYERTADAVVRYAADKDGFVRQNIIKEVQKFVYDKVEGKLRWGMKAQKKSRQKEKGIPERAFKKRSLNLAEA